MFQRLVRSNVYFRFLQKTLQLLDARQRVRAFWILLLTLINSVVEVAGLALIVPVIYLINDPSPIYRNKYLHYIFERSGFQEEQHFIFALIALLVVLFTLKNLFSIFVYYRQNQFAYDTSIGLIERQMSHLFSSSYLRVLDRNSNYIVRDIANIPGEFARNVLIPILRVTNEWIVVAVIVLGLMIYNVKIFLLIFLSIVPMVGLIMYATKRRADQISLRRNDIEPLSFKVAFEAVFSFADIRLYNKEHFFVKRVSSHFRKLYDIFLWIYTLQRVPNRVMETIIIIAIMLLYGVVILWMQDSTDRIFTVLLLFATAAYRVMPSLNEILASLILMRSSSYVFDILNEHDIRFEAIDRHEKVSFAETVELRDLDYSYPASGEHILQKLNLTIYKGDMIGIFGETGSGKSTLAKILSQLLFQDSGELLVDGKPLEDQQGWHNTVAFVPQNFYLLNSSVSENIAFGYNEQEIDRQLLQKVVCQAGLDDVIVRLEEGMNTTVGEFGAKLSGGQSQRLALARALYKGTELLILDESTSALDPETEHRLLETLRQLHREEGLTVLIISHKRSTLSYCRRRFVLKGGILTESMAHT